MPVIGSSMNRGERQKFLINIDIFSCEQTNGRHW